MVSAIKFPLPLLFAQGSNPFLDAEPVEQGSGPRVRRGGRGVPHSPEFKQCVSQEYKSCADKFGLDTLTRCLVDGTKPLEECQAIFDAYSKCLSDAYKECSDKYVW
jgi:hypothetical protein